MAMDILPGHRARPLGTRGRDECVTASAVRVLPAVPLLCLLFCAFFCLATPSTGVAQGTPDARSVEEALDKLTRSDRYDFVLPDAQVPAQPPIIIRPDRKSIRIPSKIMLLILLVAIAIVGYLLLPWISNLRYGGGVMRKADRPYHEWEAAGGPEQTHSAGDLSRAQAFAAAGDYASAVHELWLGIVYDLGSNDIRSVTPAETGREILRALRDRASLASVLGTLVRKVEISHFGGRELNDGDYSECLAAFHRARDYMAKTD